MKIVIDAREIRSGMTGVGRYTAALAAHLPAGRPGDRFVFLALRGSARDRPAPASNAEWMEVDADNRRHPAGDWWEHRVLPRLLDDLGAGVFHGPAYLIPFLGKPPRAARVLTLHDLSVFTLPGAYPAGFRWYLRWVVARGLRAADRVVCDSDFVRREALRLFPRLGAGKFVAVPLAPGPNFRPAGAAERESARERHHLPASFLLMVGTLEKRKNPSYFRHLFDALSRRLGAATPALVWAGSLGFGGKRILADLEPLRSRGVFHFVEAPGSARMLALYQCAEMLVYPSLSEGFGLPVLEAMACGLPVVASDTSSLPEAVGDGGLCLPLSRPEAWADEIALLLGDQDRRREASRRALAHAARFSWEATARRTAEVYDQAAAARARNREPGV
jgi:alpha-1,3-rhamnosyl/mannosyltransferase